MTNTTNINNNEIDLVEFIKVLWQKKIWIVLSAIFFTIIAGIYAFTAKEKWTSQTEVIAPGLLELGNYLSLKNDYAQIMRQDLVSEHDISKELFAKFDLLVYSLDNRERFFEQSDEFKRLSEDSNEFDKLLILNNLVIENISLEKKESKRNSDLLGKKIRFSSETAVSAQSTLKSFVDFTSQQAIHLDINEFKSKIDNQITRLKYELNVLENGLKIYKNIQLDNLNNAYNIAKEAGIKEYGNSEKSVESDTLSSSIKNDAQISLSESKMADSPYLFMLGEKYLKAQINVISNAKLIYPSSYYLMSSQLKQLTDLQSTLEQNNGAKAYKYISSPSYPVKKDAPKRAILLVIGALLGGIISSIFILAKELFNKQ